MILHRRHAASASLLGLLFISTAALADVVPSTSVNSVATETGPHSINSTAANWDVGGTDLGIPWDDGHGRLLMAFGDSFADTPAYGPGSLDWRHGGTLAMSTDFSPADGVTFSGMISDDGQATNAITPAAAPGEDWNCIPTGGTSIDNTDFIHFLSVEDWCDAGLQTYRSGLAWRESGSNTPFEILPPSDITWGPASNFGQVAMITLGNYVYMLGTPPGRLGGIKLARAEGSLGAALDGWQYWDGTTWQWRDEAAGIFLVPPPVSELSVQFDAFYGRFIMTYLDPTRNEGSSQPGAIILRDAPSLEGPWSEEKEIMTNAAHPAEYGGFLYPFEVSGNAFGNGNEIYFNVSEWGIYNVLLFHTTLSWRAEDENLVTDPGFEDQVSTPVTAPWTLDGAGSIASGANAAHLGQKAAYLSESASEPAGSWHDIYQSIAVKPYADYELTAWVRSGNLSAGFAGVRTRGLPVPVNGVDMCSGMTALPDLHTPIAQTSFGDLASYTPLTVRFNAGDRSLLDVFVGIWGNGNESWAFVDDVTVTPLEHVNDGSFEMQPSTQIGWPYDVEGTGAKGIDQGTGLTYVGDNDAWINTTNSDEWNAITELVTVTPNTNYVFKGWVQTSTPFGAGFFGVRNSEGVIINEVQYGAQSSYGEQTVSFNSGASTSVRLYAGYWTPSGGQGTWLRVDGLSIEPE